MINETYPHVSFIFGIFNLFILFSGLIRSIRHMLRDMFGRWNLIDMLMFATATSIVGVIFGILALVKKSKRRGLAIIGLLLNLFVPSAIGFLLWLL